MNRLFRGSFIVWVALRYGLDELVLTSFQKPWLRLLARIVSVGRRLDAPRGQRLREALERLGPIFVKFGQVLSTRRDLLPLDVADELAKLANEAVVGDGLQQPQRASPVGAQAELQEPQEPAFHIDQVGGEQEQSHQLSRKGLGRSHTDLGTGASQHHQIRFAHQRTLRHIADRERRHVAALPGHPQCGQRIGGFA